MKDEIRRYLEEHGATYTPDALRGGLLEAGYDPAEVDAALGTWATERAQAGGGQDDRRSFGKWSLLIYLGALLAVFLVTVPLNGTEPGLAVIAAVVLGVFLLIAWGVSSLLGRLLVPRVGLLALVLPLAFALGLGGTCLAIMDGMTPERPTAGTVELRIEPPLSFTGSGTAACFVELDGRSSSLSAENLGEIEGRTVAVTVDNFAVTSQPIASPEPVSGPDAPSLFITLSPTSDTDRGFGYSTIFNTRLVFQSSTDGRSGTVTFEGLAPEPGGEPGVVPTDPISGTVTWTCEPRR
ncbi:MAG: hypothetical protein ABJC24_00015 [Chloroflexota bacterium]